MMTKQPLYLNREGKTTGPFDWNTLQSMFAHEKLQGFDWYWDPIGEAWKPIDELVGAIAAEYVPPQPQIAPPPVLHQPTHPTAVESQSQIGSNVDPDGPIVIPRQKSAQATVTHLPRVAYVDSKARMLPPISVICFDGEKTYSGTLERASEKRCWISSFPGEGKPPFLESQEIRINLLSEATLSTVTTRVKILKLDNLGSVWNLELQWLDRPTEMITDLNGNIPLPD